MTVRQFSILFLMTVTFNNSSQRGTSVFLATKSILSFRRKYGIYFFTFQVRISVTTTLTQTSLQIDEGWYNVVDGTKVIELEGPIYLTKKEAIAENP